MLNIISLIIIREIFINLNKNDLSNFKFITKRIFNFVNRDRICQKYYLKEKYPNLKFKHGYYENLEQFITDLDKRKYSQYLCNSKIIFKDSQTFFIRLFDNKIIIFDFDCEVLKEDDEIIINFFLSKGFYYTLIYENIIINKSVFYCNKIESIREAMIFYCFSEFFVNDCETQINNYKKNIF